MLTVSTNTNNILTTMTPPLVINDVEVININPLLRYFALIVHLKVLPDQVNAVETSNLLREKVDAAVKYLMAEGFLPDIVKERWLVDIAGVCHPPSDNYGQNSPS